VQVFDDFINTFVSDLEIPVLMIPGNHDSVERARFGSRQMCEAGVYIFGNLEDSDKPVTLNLAGKSVSFHGMPYNDPESVRNTFDVEVRYYDSAHAYLVDQIQSAMDLDQLNILISHCFIEGCMESDSERPLSIGGAEQVDPGNFSTFDYVALGHLHQQQKRGEDYIRYAGSILKYSFSEQHHKKGVTLV
jgi:exonuclease SbcD